MPNSQHPISATLYDAAMLQLEHAIGILHCVQAAADPDNANVPGPRTLLVAIDAATAMIENAHRLLTHAPPELVYLHREP